MPVEYSVTIGYHPSIENGAVIGLSKPIRLARILACQPILQETYIQNIADRMMEKLNADGVAVITKGMHGCMKF